LKPRTGLNIYPRPNIYIADQISPGGLSLLRKKFNLISLEGLGNSALIKKISLVSNSNIKKSALIIRSARKIDSPAAKKIRELTDINLICTVSSGYDNIDIEACAKHRIRVMNVPGANSISAGEFTVALILLIFKNIIPADYSMKKGIFDSREFPNYELFGQTIGIIGVGRVGSYVAKISKAMGMKILGNDINPKLKNKYKWIKFASLNTLLKSSDIVTIHTPLDESTRNLINKAGIALMKKSAVLINCSRGGTVYENALINALKKGKIRYAAIDVFENEPGFNEKFAKLPNVILTPHLAGKTLESRKRMSVQAAENIIKFYSKAGKTLKLVN
jgi:D-3-phosphoglycerate dehydrogenase